MVVLLIYVSFDLCHWIGYCGDRVVMMMVMVNDEIKFNQTYYLSLFISWQTYYFIIDLVYNWLSWLTHTHTHNNRTNVCLYCMHFILININRISLSIYVVSKHLLNLNSQIMKCQTIVHYRQWSVPITKFEWTKCTNGRPVIIEDNEDDDKKNVWRSYGWAGHTLYLTTNLYRVAI